MRSNHDRFLQQVSPDWEKIPLEGYGNIFSGGTPSRDNPSFWNGSIAWVTPGEITELNSKYLTSTRENISNKGLQNSAAKLLPSGSVLVTSRATIGAIAIAKIPITTNQGFKSLVPDEPNQSEYIYYLLNFIAPEFVRLATGSTFNEISRRDFVSIMVPRPSPVEQYRIATILDSVDKAIRQTEALIAKFTQIKAGLLHDLLTCGVNEKGELRDSVLHTNQFQNSSIGLLPCEWEVVELETIAADQPNAIVDGPFGSNLKSIHYRDHGIPVIQSGYVTSGVFKADSYVYVSERLFNSQKRSAVKPGDIIMAKIGAQAGTSAILPDNHPVSIIAGNTLKITTDSQKCRNRFLLRVLHYYYDIGIIDRIRSETAQPAIRLSSLKRLRIPLPNPLEQDRIVEILDGHDFSLLAEQSNLDKLKKIKQGLMQDLLTGSVRVNEINLDLPEV